MISSGQGLDLKVNKVKKRMSVMIQPSALKTGIFTTSGT